MDKENLNGQTVEDITEDGKEESNMEKVLILMRKERKKEENGLTEKESDGLKQLMVRKKTDLFYFINYKLNKKRNFVSLM